LNHHQGAQEAQIFTLERKHARRSRAGKQTRNDRHQATVFNGEINALNR